MEKLFFSTSAAERGSAINIGSLPDGKLWKHGKAPFVPHCATAPIKKVSANSQAPLDYSVLKLFQHFRSRARKWWAASKVGYFFGQPVEF
ncbi:MAG: hypothetical protein ACTTKC_03985 [Treponema sp.]|uniref:hypothetical protein n=1 Tax=Treponema sp. TaxID=166 RepID=UPI003FA2E0D5